MSSYVSLENSRSPVYVYVENLSARLPLSYAHTHIKTKHTIYIYALYRNIGDKLNIPKVISVPILAWSSIKCDATSSI